MDLSNIVFGVAVLLILAAAIIIAIMKWWDGSDWYTKAFVAICAIIGIGALAVIYWQVTLAIAGFVILVIGAVYLITRN